MATITDISQLDLSKQYTYADYLTWRFEGMVELLKGYIYKVEPFPGTYKLTNIYGREDKVRLKTLPNLEIDMNDVFDDIL